MHTRPAKPRVQRVMFCYITAAEVTNTSSSFPLRFRCQLWHQLLQKKHRTVNSGAGRWKPRCLPMRSSLALNPTKELHTAGDPVAALSLNFDMVTLWSMHESRGGSHLCGQNDGNSCILQKLILQYYFYWAGNETITRELFSSNSVHSICMLSIMSVGVGKSCRPAFILHTIASQQPHSNAYET